MKLLRYGLCALLLGLVGVSPAAAQFNNVGTSAANFLKIPVGPRGTAVGGAYTALTNDATSLYWNVAALDLGRRRCHHHDLQQDAHAGGYLRV